MKKILLNDVNLISGGNKSSSTEYKPDYDESIGTLTLHRYDGSNLTLHNVTYEGESYSNLIAESFDVLKKIFADLQKNNKTATIRFHNKKFGVDVECKGVKCIKNHWVENFLEENNLINFIFLFKYT